MSRVTVELDAEAAEALYKWTSQLAECWPYHLDLTRACHAVEGAYRSAGLGDPKPGWYKGDWKTELARAKQAKEGA